MEQTAALIVFSPDTTPAEAKAFLQSIRELAKVSKIVAPNCIERMLTQEFDTELGPVVLYQP